MPCTLTPLPSESSTTWMYGAACVFLSVEPHGLPLRLPRVTAPVAPPFLLPPVVDDIFATLVSFVGRCAHNCRRDIVEQRFGCMKASNRYPCHRDLLSSGGSSTSIKSIFLPWVERRQPAHPSVPTQSKLPQLSSMAELKLDDPSMESLPAQTDTVGRPPESVPRGLLCSLQRGVLVEAGLIRCC